MHRFFIIYACVILLTLIGGITFAVAFYGPKTWGMLGQEFGFIENMTALLFVIVAILAGFLFFKAKHKVWLGFSFLMAIVAMREMDYHKSWTSDSIFKTNFYEGPNYPIHEKILGGMVILVLIYAVIKVGRHIPEWIGNLIRFRPNAIAIFFGLGLLAFAKLLDGFKRYVPQYGDIHRDNAELFNMIEESCELASASFFLSICLIKILELRRAKAF